MRGPEPIRALRVVATPPALDAIGVPVGAHVVRLAPDDALVVGAPDVTVADPDAIVERDDGWVVWSLTEHDLATVIAPRVHWPLPAGRPAVAPGLVAGVPAVLRLHHEWSWLLCSAVFAHELAERLR
ncbi:MAG: hypothetical protein ACKO91_14535 [Acidimicrobiales bacterium]